MEISVAVNEARNGIEITFDEKPDEAVRAQMKANGFRWSRHQGLWYARNSAERLKFAESLAGTEAESYQPEPASFPEIDIDDIHNYTVSPTLQRAEHEANWIFRRSERDRSAEIQSHFEHYNQEVKEILAIPDCTEEIAYRLKSALQRYKKKYYANFIGQLRNKASNPSWAVTGPAGRNARRDAKMASRYDSLMKESIELTEEMDRALYRARNAIGNARKVNIRNQVEATEINVEFKVGKEEVDLTACGRPYVCRTYRAGDYMIAKTWGCFRIFKDGKQVHRMRTTDKLTDAKKYVCMMLEKEAQ